MSDRLEILKKIENGEITPEEGTRLIEELTLNNTDTPDEENSTLNILSKIESIFSNLSILSKCFAIILLHSIFSLFVIFSLSV